jgi:hypothetical protein
VQNFDAALPRPRPLPLSLVLLVGLAVHLPLLTMKLPLRSYDTNFHIFFASHYAQHWFDPWNPKWYAGFSQTTYPPLAQQWIAIISRFVGLDAGYMIIQLAAILLLAVGVYRFSRLWVDERAASFAALASVFLGSESFLVYSAGQLSTTTAAPLYLNALPYFYFWIRSGDWRAFLKGWALTVAAAAVHHATLLFGSILFALPVVLLALMNRRDPSSSSSTGTLARIVAFVGFAGGAIAIVLLPFWIALYHYPVTQAPIPHPSRANYILNPEWGVNYFLIPYGALILALPFILVRGSTVPRLRPLLLGFWIAFLLGLGGTTFAGRFVLGRAFEVITMERFSYWATLLALPFVGVLVEEFLARFRLAAAVGFAVAACLTCAMAVSWSTYHPADAGSFNVESVALWLNRDGHDRYRYLTLGFGNQISRLAAKTDAGSVDGEWNSGRMLPELTHYGVGALTSAKYFGEGGIESLRAMLRHADRYGLRWVFCRDAYYEPLLAFVGFRKVDTLENGTIGVWAKDDVPPATVLPSPQVPPEWQGLLWGTLPVASSILAILLVFIPEPRRLPDRVREPSAADEDLVSGRLA